MKQQLKNAAAIIMAGVMAIMPVSLQANTVPHTGAFVRVTSEQYSAGHTFLNNTYVLMQHEGFFGVINLNGNITAVPFVYRQLRLPTSPITFNRPEQMYLNAQDSDGNWGVIDLHGNIILPFEYSHEPDQLRLGQHPSQYRFIVSQTGGDSSGRLQSGMVDGLNNVIIPINFDWVSPLQENFIRVSVRTGGTRIIAGLDSHISNNGVMDLNGNELLPIEYAEIDAIRNNMAVVREEVDSNRGVVELGTNRQVLPFAYEQIQLFDNGLIGVSGAVDSQTTLSWTIPEPRWGLVDTTGRMIMPENYSRSDVSTVAGLRSLPPGSIRAHHANVANIHWNELRGTLGTNEMEILDLQTGRTARARSISNGNHADIVGINDTYQAMLAEFLGRSYFDSDLLVTVNGQSMLASHDRFAPSTHFCLHFYGSTQNNDGRSWGIGGAEQAATLGRLIRAYVLH